MLVFLQINSIQEMCDGVLTHHLYAVNESWCSDRRVVYTKCVLVFLQTTCIKLMYLGTFLSTYARMCCLTFVYGVLDKVVGV